VESGLRPRDRTCMGSLVMAGTSYGVRNKDLPPRLVDGCVTQGGEQAAWSECPIPGSDEVIARRKMSKKTTKNQCAINNSTMLPIEGTRTEYLDQPEKPKKKQEEVPSGVLSRRKVIDREGAKVGAQRKSSSGRSD
jgi:hypothetical protein